MGVIGRERVVRNSKSGIRCAVLFLLLAAGVLFPALATAETVIKIGGSGGALGSMKRLAEAFMRSHPGVKIQVLSSLGSSGGIKALMAGVLDLAVSGRPLKDDEKAKGGTEIQYARTPLVFVVHSKVAGSAVTTHELEQIYGGQMPDWPDGSRIRLVIRPEGDSDTQLLRGISPAMDQAVKSAIGKAGMNFAVTDQDSIDMVTKVPGSLGAATLSQIMTERPPVKVLAYNGVKPVVKAMAKGRYPLSKPLYLITMNKSAAAAREFAAFVRSPAGKRILANSGNQPI